MRNLLKALLTTGGAALAAQVLALVVNKILAQAVGTTGIGFYSLTRQVHDTAVGFGAIGAGGLVQGLAAREGAARKRLFAAAALLTACGATVVAGALLLAPEMIGRALFDRSEPAISLTIMLCAATAAIGVAYATLNAAINALRAIVALGFLVVGGSAVTALIAWPLAREAVSTPQVLVALIGVPLAVQTLAAWLVLRRLGWWRDLAAAGPARPGRSEFRYFGGFFGFNVAMGAIATAATLAVRAGIVHDGGLAAAGLFAAAWNIGMHSISLVLSSFGTYVLPTVAAAGPEERRQHLQDAATMVLCGSIPVVVGLIAFKALVVQLLFSADFLPAVPLLQWLLLGNYLKAVSWVMAIPLLATADLRRYFVIEAGWYGLFAALALLGMKHGGGLESVGVAYFVPYVAYLAASATFARRRFGFVLHRRALLVFVAGGALIAAVAGLTWNGPSVDWTVALPAVAAAGLVSLFGLTPARRGKLLGLMLRQVRR